MAISEMAISFLSAAKVQQKMHIRKQSEHFFEKWIDLSIEYAIHFHDRSLLMRVKSEWHIHKVQSYFTFIAPNHIRVYPASTPYTLHFTLKKSPFPCIY